MIDKRVGNSKKIAQCSEKARNLWFMLYPHLDRDGRIAFDDLQDLKTEIIPYLRWSLGVVSNVLNELVEVGLIHLYPQKAKFAIEYIRFLDFQQGLRYDRESPSEVSPYGGTPETSGDFRISPDNSLLSLSLSLRKFKEGRKESKEDVAFDFQRGEFLFISEKDKEIWQKAFPACDIQICLHQMAAWLLANPDKTKKNYKRFIVNWLTKEQQRGGTKGTGKEESLADYRKRIGAKDE